MAAGDDHPWDLVFGYDPLLERWRAGAPPPAGIRTLEPTWTGTMALYFSGLMPADIYDPTRDRWFSLPATGDRTRESEAGLWAGDRFIAWGGGEGESFLRKPDGMAFVPDTRNVDALAHEGHMPVHVEIADASGQLLDARTANDDELGRPARWDESFVEVGGGPDGHSLLIRWIGGPSDDNARLEIGPSRVELALVAIPTYGDSIPVLRGIMLTFGEAIDPSDVSVAFWGLRGLD